MIKDSKSIAFTLLRLLGVTAFAFLAGWLITTAVNNYNIAFIVISFAFCAGLLFISFKYEGKRAQNFSIACFLSTLEFFFVFVPLRDSPGGTTVFLSPIVVFPLCMALVPLIREKFTKPADRDGESEDGSKKS